MPIGMQWLRSTKNGISSLTLKKFAGLHLPALLSADVQSTCNAGESTGIRIVSGVYMNWKRPLNQQFWKHWQRGLATSPGATKVFRDPRFAKLEESDVQHFQEIVGDKGVIVDSSELEVANTDWMNKYHGQSQLLLRPQTTQQVGSMLYDSCKEKKEEYGVCLWYRCWCCICARCQAQVILGTSKLASHNTSIHGLYMCMNHRWLRFSSFATPGVWQLCLREVTLVWLEAVSQSLTR